jgi:glyoxylase-like metal-dependent hydrolase (beta-lactamase superfamily II)
MPRFAAFVAAALAAVAAPPAIVAQRDVVRTADPAKRGLKESDFPRTIKVADNVYTYEDFHAGPEKFTTTNMFVVTSDGVLVADGQGSAEQTKGLVDAIAKVTPKRIEFVVICSDHGDHTGGNRSFPRDVKYIVHPLSKATLDKQSARTEADGRSGRGGAGAWALPIDAELVFQRKMLVMGGEEIQILFLGRAHTGGDLTVYLPRQKILFLSETFLNRVFPAMRTAYPSDWLKALDRAEAMKADLYIPGHGFTESGPVSKEELAAYRRALAAVIAEGTRLYKAGVPVDEAVKQANWGQYRSWTLAASQGPIAVRRVYEELSGALK